MSEQDQRLAYAAAQDQAQARPSAAAHADREARTAADEAQLRAGAHPGHDEQLTYHQGLPTAETQMKTPGAPHTGSRRPRLMELYPLRTGLPDLAQLAARGEVSRLYREPRTVEQVLEGARAALEAEDEAERQAASGKRLTLSAWARTQRARRTLWGRLLYGRG
jgi:hypothetical protein